MKKITLTALSADLKMSYNGVVKKVQKLVQDKKLKDKIKLTEEINEKGRKVKTVLISEDLYKKLKKEHALYNNNTEKSEISENEQVQSENEQLKNNKSEEFMQKLVSELIDSKNQLVNYAEQVGKVRLLTDNLMDREKDAKYWQERYFELKFELEKVKQENQQYKEKENKKWWQVKVF